MRTDPAVPTPQEIAEQLRRAGAWLYLAADDVDRHDLDQARKKSWMGSWTCLQVPFDIDRMRKAVTS